MIDFDIIIDELLEREEEIDPDLEDIDMGAGLGSFDEVMLRDTFVNTPPPPIPAEVRAAVSKLKEFGQGIQDIRQVASAQIKHFNKGVVFPTRKLVYNWLRQYESEIRALEAEETHWGGRSELYRKLRGSYMSDYKHEMLGRMIAALIRDIEKKKVWWERHHQESTQEG